MSHQLLENVLDVNGLTMRFGGLLKGLIPMKRPILELNKQ